MRRRAPRIAADRKPTLIEDQDTPTLHVVSNVTVPTLIVVRPAAALANGTGMIVIPGGFKNSG